MVYSWQSTSFLNMIRSSVPLDKSSNVMLGQSYINVYLQLLQTGRSINIADGIKARALNECDMFSETVEGIACRLDFPVVK